MIKQLVIRADSNVNNGSGHIMRCLSLVQHLKDVKVSFVCRSIPYNFVTLLEKNNCKVFQIYSESETANKDNLDIILDANETIKIIKQNKIEPDWILVDHYKLDYRWESILRSCTKKIIVIDDLANRKHDCDLLIDQNLYHNMYERYKELVPKRSVMLLGPQYAILRSEFREIRKNIRKRDGQLKTILISFGSSDSNNETSKAIKAITRLENPNLKIDVVVGILNPYKEVIMKSCATLNFTYHHQTEEMGTLMANADISIGAGGTTTWERCCLGLPAIVSIISEDQYELTNAVEKQGCVINLGYSNLVSIDEYVNTIRKLDVEKLRIMEKNCMLLVDGFGGIRVAEKILSM